MKDKNKPLVSVIVPVYNTERYLKRCLDSIITQTYENLDIILVNDGSTDASGRICDAYAGKDSRIRVIHQDNAGQAVARNKAMDIAGGEWFSFIDSDDFVCDAFLERMLRYGMDYDADIVSCRWRAGKENKIASPKGTLKPEMIKVYSGRECYCNYFTAKKLPAIESMGVKLFKAELFCNLRLIEGKTYEDMAIMHQLFERAERVVFADEQLYYYFQSPNSTIRGKFTLKKLYEIKCYEERLDYFYKIGGKSLWGRALQQYQDTLFRYYYLTKRDCGDSQRALKILFRKIRKNNVRLQQQSNISAAVKVFSQLGTCCPALAGFVSNQLIAIRFWRR